MAKRKNETETNETFEVKSMESIAETEKSNESSNITDTSNDAGTYDFTENTFAESQKNPAETQNALDVDVDAILEQYGTKKKRGRKPKTENVPQDIPVLIPGELLVHVSDNVCVGTISFFDSLLSKKPIDAQLLALRDEQKSQLVPAANEASKELSKYINANPLLAFGAMLGSMYVSNYLIIRALMIQADRNKEK